MDFFEVVEKRKAVRKYSTNQVIPAKDLEKILQTINLAPSARNLQSYQIFAAVEKKAIKEVAATCFNQRSDFAGNASLILVFCLNPKQAEEVFGERGKDLYTLQDATIAATFAVLSATALGYASCWVGNFREEDLRKVLKTTLRPVAMIIIGIGEENPERKPRKNLQELVQYL